MDIRGVILRRMAEQEVTSRYLLAQQLKGKVGQRNLYDFLDGKADMTSTKIGHILDVLRIDLVARPVEAWEPCLGRQWRGERDRTRRPWRRWPRHFPDSSKLD
jgi:hypothetical protein